MELNHASIIKTRKMSVLQVKKSLSAAVHLTEDYMMLACPEAEFLDEIQTKV